MASSGKLRAFLFLPAIQPVLRRGTGRFAAQNGPPCNALAARQLRGLAAGRKKGGQRLPLPAP